MGELNSRLAMIVDRNSGILNENKHLKETMDMEKKKYADEVTNFRNLFFRKCIKICYSEYKSLTIILANEGKEVV